MAIDAAHQDEQGQRLPGPRGGGGGLAPITPVKSPLDAGHASDIIAASGLGAHRNLSKSQFPQMPGQNTGDAAEGEAGAGAGEAAAGAGAGEAVDLLALAAL